MPVLADLICQAVWGDRLQRIGVTAYVVLFDLPCLNTLHQVLPYLNDNPIHNLSQLIPDSLAFGFPQRSTNFPKFYKKLVDFLGEH
jgi:hypothetical protein